MMRVSKDSMKKLSKMILGN